MYYSNPIFPVRFDEFVWLNNYWAVHPHSDEILFDFVECQNLAKDLLEY